MIERLGFGEGQRFAALESAIHLNRYLLARRFCSGKRVLDVACGEGYGSYFLAERWGAASVDGVDASEEAIARARSLFASERVRYHVSPAEAIDRLFRPGTFDLVVCMETIEHLENPVRFLEHLRELLRLGGVALISCPNDHWYYRTDAEQNPFHLRKYTFDEFRLLTESVLGPATRHMLGLPISGFANLEASERGLATVDPGVGPRAMFESRPDSEAMVVPPNEHLSWQESSYFVGLWGPADIVDSSLHAAWFPASMTTALPFLRAQPPAVGDRIQAIAVLERERVRAIEAIGRQLADRQPEPEPRHEALRLAGVRAENTYLREEMSLFRLENTYLREELALLQPEIIQLREELGVLRPAHSQLQEELGVLRPQNTHLQEEMAIASQRIVELEQGIAELEQALARLAPDVIPLKQFLFYSRDFARAKIPGWPGRVRNLAKRALRKALRALGAPDGSGR